MFSFLYQQAFHFCRVNGDWAPRVNVSQCAYTSQVTETLHKFATMTNNATFDARTLLESAKHFLNFTCKTLRIAPFH